MAGSQHGGKRNQLGCIAMAPGNRVLTNVVLSMALPTATQAK